MLRHYNSCSRKNKEENIFTLTFYGDIYLAVEGCITHAISG